MGGAALMFWIKYDLAFRFNAARGFVGGAAPVTDITLPATTCFNAARGFVGGAASSLAALSPLGRKSPFGKSPEIREF